MNIGVVLAGGSGERFGSKTPKQYLKIDGHEVIYYSIAALKKSRLIDKVLVVASDDQAERLSKTYDVEIVPNGSSRNLSLKSALTYIAYRYPECVKIIILEAARPMITARIVDEYLSLLDEYDSVITGQRIVDSLGCYKLDFVNRDDFYLIQAPESFVFPKLNESFDENSKITATNQQMPKDSKLFINFEFKNNFKITYPQDLHYCESFLRKYEV